MVEMGLSIPLVEEGEEDAEEEEDAMVSILIFNELPILSQYMVKGKEKETGVRKRVERKGLLAKYMGECL